MDPLSERLKNMTPLQRAVFALKETQNKLDAIERRRNEPIAIVGMACRFPGGAIDPLTYWQMLCDGVDAIREIPADRWNADDFYDPDPTAPGKMSSRSGGFLDRIDEFDNHFFAISDTEAARIDPQQRILMELAWEAMEDAGVAPSKVRGTKIGVFIGISSTDYGMMLSSDLAQCNAYVAVGTSLCLAANRLSFVLGLQGPSMALDTACSSSLVAVHLACQHIRSGECDGALVGGANLLLSPMGTINLTKAGFCATDGRVRAFDAAATGYVRSEGAGVVMLKPLSAAIKNSDPIYAVIRGSAVNQNGSSNGITAPSRAAQEQVLREAYARAQVSPGQVGFVETQGTGTRLGDVIEATALGNVMRQDRLPGSRCTLGAVETNIGHLEAASGMASLMKAALALKERQLPGNLHFKSLNPEIAIDALPLEIPRALSAWPDAAHPRFAGVNAFGFGGSNAHVVLEEPHAAPADASAVSARHPQLLPLSGRTDDALRALAERYNAFLEHDAPAWSDICHTAAARRDHHDCRLALLAESREQAAILLAGWLSGKSLPDVYAGRKPYGRDVKVAFLYDDQFEGWKTHAAQLTEAVPGVLAAAQEIDAALLRVTGRSLESVLAKENRWDEPTLVRPMLVALQLALTAWWRRAGVAPDVVVGQGVGELAAAAVAGILTPEESLELAAVQHGNTNGNGAALPKAPPQRAASLPFISCFDGKLHAGADLDSSHWTSCIHSAAGVNAAVTAIANRRVDVCLEIGVASLGVSASRRLAEKLPAACVVASLRPSETGGVTTSAALGALYVAGAELHWDRLSPAGARHVRVPTYPWQRQRLWAPVRNHLTDVSQRAAGADAASHAQADPAVSATVAEITRRPDLTTPYAAPQTPLEAAMVESWSSILRMEGIGIHDNFFELGGDSLQATILLNRLQEQLGETVPGHALFQVQSINALSDYLRRHCTDAVRRQYPEELVDEPPSADAAGDGQPPTLTASGAAIPRQARGQHAEELLARLDDLADDEVELLLSKAMADDEVSL